MQKECLFQDKKFSLELLHRGFCMSLNLKIYCLKELKRGYKMGQYNWESNSAPIDNTEQQRSQEFTGFNTCSKQLTLTLDQVAQGPVPESTEKTTTQFLAVKLHSFQWVLGMSLVHKTSFQFCYLAWTTGPQTGRSIIIEVIQIKRKKIFFFRY